MTSSKSVLALLSLLTFFCTCVARTTPSAGCGKALPTGLSPGGPSRNFTIYSKGRGGGTRRFLVHLPDRFSGKNDSPARLILAFHGQTQTTASLEKMTGFSDPYFNRDAIAVYPEGLDYKAPGHQWLGDPEAPPSSVLDDRVFVSDLLDHLTATYCVDENRIYAAGLSNGGGLVGLLACSPVLNRRIAAFAMVAGAFYTDGSLTEPLFGKGCQPDLAKGMKVPIMEWHGKKDTVIGYDGNNSPAPNTIPVYQWVREWVAREGCVMQGPKVAVWDPYIARFGWNCEREGLNDVVAHYQVTNLGHGWPSTVPLEGSWTDPIDLNATAHMMLFFDEWKLDRILEPYE